MYAIMKITIFFKIIYRDRWRNIKKMHRNNLESPFPEEAVYGLDLVPALGSRHLGQVGRRLLVACNGDQ